MGERTSKGLNGMAARSPLKSGHVLRCSGGGSSFYSTCGTRRVTLVTNPIQRHEWERTGLWLR